MKCPYCSSYVRVNATCTQCGGPMRASSGEFNRIMSRLATGFRLDIRPGAMNQLPLGHEHNYIQTYEVN